MDGWMKEAIGLIGGVVVAGWLGLMLEGLRLPSFVPPSTVQPGGSQLGHSGLSKVRSGRVLGGRHGMGGGSRAGLVGDRGGRG